MPLYHAPGDRQRSGIGVRLWLFVFFGPLLTNFILVLGEKDVPEVFPAPLEFV